MTSGTTSWYEIISGNELRQGDVLRAFPIPTIQGLDEWPLPSDPQLQVNYHESDVVVLSQSCDLEHSKIYEVILCEVIPWNEVCRQLVEQGHRAASGKRYREALVAGNVPGLSLLHHHSAEVKFPWSVVDFHRISVVPKKLAQAVAQRAGDRLRLCSPYREHLAQAFARYFMRVGLPHDAQAFIHEGRQQ